MKTYYIVVDSASISMIAELGAEPKAELRDNPTGCYVIKAIEARNYAEATTKFDNWSKTPGKRIRIPIFGGWSHLMMAD